MSLLAYCQKASDGEQNSHCKTKCINCIVGIAKIKAITEYKFNNIKQ